MHTQVHAEVSAKLDLKLPLLTNIADLGKYLCHISSPICIDLSGITPILFHYSYNTIAASCIADISKKMIEKKKYTTQISCKVSPSHPLQTVCIRIRVWSAGCMCLQLHHSSILEGRFTNERRSAPLFIHHCLPHHPLFPLSFHSSLLPSHCLACSRMWR